MMDGTPLRRVDDFVYLGCTVNCNGTASTDVSHIIGLARLTAAEAEQIMRCE